MTIYPIQYYNSPVGSIVILNKLFDESIPVSKTIKAIEKSKNIKELVKSYLVLLYTKIKDTNARIVEFNTIRGPIYRLQIDNVIRPLREDGFPDPSFITHSDFRILEEKDFEPKSFDDEKTKPTTAGEPISEKPAEEVL